ncbi:MAG: GAF domain-containing protein, partial [Myxococcales bacterium]|nr:GAF domain-containing protein [Myxococcales bacterium]
EYLNAHVERGDALSELLLNRAVRVLDKVKVYETRIVYSTLRSDLLAAVESGYQAMSLLGLDVPRQIDMAGFFELLRETKLVIGDRRAADLLALPAMKSPERLAAARIAAQMASPSYFVDALLSLAISLRVLALSLPYGNAPESPFLYSFFALIHASQLSDFDTSEEYGRLARTLVDQDTHGRVRARVYNLLSIFVLHYKSHVRETLPMLVDVVKTAMESGDLEYMGYGAINHCMHQFLVGERLETCLQDNERFLELASRYRLGIVANWIRTVSQAALNLHAGAADPRRLVGDVFDEDAAVPELIASNNNRALSLLHISKTILGVLFRDDQSATQAAETAERFIQAQTGQFAVVSFHFYRALAFAAHARRSDAQGRSRCLQKIEGDLERLRKWAAAGPMNSRHRLRLVEAEFARVQGDDLAAMRLYGEAIDDAARYGWTHEEALAHELEGEHYLACGLARMGRASLVEARHTYQRWGARAKVAQLEQRYPDVFATAPNLHERRDDERTPASASSSGAFEFRAEAEVMLDLPAVLRAAQAISGEIVLDRLLDKLMSIVIENAGAQRGVLVLPRAGNDGLEVVAERTAARGATRLAASLEGNEFASSAIIHYVVRTGESVVLADATTHGLFTADPYVVRRRSKSILCAPLVNQGHLVAVVYLENDLAVGAFTEGRVEVLRVLSAQAALSVHNALLYARLEEHNRTLEQKVSERTHELVDKNEELARTLVQLRETQEQLVLREKMASLGTLTAGIAHELRNPFNFINNFAQLSKELTAELEVEMDAWIDTPDESRRADIDGILRDLSNNAASIERHGLRVNNILNSMLVHTVVENKERVPTDLNNLVRQSAYLAHSGAQTRYGAPGARLEASYDSTMPSVEASSELSRVFINLVENACYATMQKSSSEGGTGYDPEIRVSTADLGNHVEVRIRDNGTGIAKEHQDKIFNPFFTTKPPGDGTGLGLSLSYNIVVRKHGGSIRVDSKEGQYAEFVVSLPKKFERK